MSPQFSRAGQSLTPARWLLAAALVLVLFLLGIESDTVFAALTRAWQTLFELAGLGSWLARMQHGTSSLVTTRSLPAVVTYSLLYVGLCLLLLHVLLRDGQRTRWAAQVYLGLLGLYIILMLVGRLGGNASGVYNLGRRIIDFIVSPLPVMILLPVLWPGTRRFFD
ncbi:hypothetical protein GKZ68_06645 [Hymenobacter sp. BRD128]|uniref:XrtX-associated membrane protein n=1 Tax=Hymenobacter sp. BRD128 TaxID=2675878 RepID=UPI0015670742|nr:hypothetical protein [Hymenobacter sp. BRD128]QKG56344.1 hypothetical protein GKZ68_06645 [Hymenobacter sp. BRD128]